MTFFKGYLLNENECVTQTKSFTLPEVSRESLEGTLGSVNTPKFTTFHPADHQEIIPATRGK